MNKIWLALMVLPLGVLCASVFLLVHEQFRSTPDVVTVSSQESNLEGGVPNAMGKNRPTPEQLDKEFMLWELRDLEKQAATPSDKALVHQALEIKEARIKALQLSTDFEKNMHKAIK